MSYALHPGFDGLKDFVLRLREEFPNSGTTLFTGRNTLKTFRTGGQVLVVKSFKIPNLVNRLAYGCLRASKAERSYLNAVKLKNLGIGTPQPVAFIEYGSGGLLRESYYLSVALENCFEIRSVFGNADFPRREEILRAFAAFTCQLHGKGVLHVDYSAGNILITGEAGAWQFSLVDLNRLRFRQLDTRSRLRSLSRLGAGPADSQAVARHYAEAAGLDPDWCVRALCRLRRAHLAKLKLKHKLRAPFKRGPRHRHN